MLVTIRCCLLALILCMCIEHFAVIIIPYSGKYWRVFQFGELAILKKKPPNLNPFNPFVTTVDTAKWRRIAKLKLAKCRL